MAVLALEYKRPIGLQLIGKEKYTIIYFRYHIASLARMVMRVDNIHMSGYMSVDFYLDIICHRPGLNNISLPPYQFDRLVRTKRWLLLADWLKSFLVMNKFVKRFWTRRKELYVRGVLSQGIPVSDVAGQIFRLWGHRIRTASLVRRAILLGWIPWRKPPPKTWPVRKKK